MDREYKKQIEKVHSKLNQQILDESEIDTQPVCDYQKEYTDLSVSVPNLTVQSYQSEEAPKSKHEEDFNKTFEYEKIEWYPENNHK